MSHSSIDFRQQQSIRHHLAGYLRLLRLAITTGLYNSIRVLSSLVLASRPMRASSLHNLVVMGFGGVGNHLFLPPALAALAKRYPEAKIHLATLSAVSADLFIGDPTITSMTILKTGRASLLPRWFRVGRALAKLQPDAILMASGTEPVFGSLTALLSGARIRVGEDWRGRAMFYTHTIPVNATVSEMRQNLKLAELLQATETAFQPRLVLAENDKQTASRLMRQLTPTTSQGILGVHPGSGHTQTWKRWDINKFIETARLITKTTDMAVVFFLGPDEKELAETIQAAEVARSGIYVATSGLRPAAALINCCDLFLSNDSGLRHIAVALGKPTVGIFGPTSAAKNAVGEKYEEIITADTVACSPCHYTRWFLACARPHPPCLDMISPDRVARLIETAMTPSEHQAKQGASKT